MKITLYGMSIDVEMPEDGVQFIEKKILDGWMSEEDVLYIHLHMKHIQDFFELLKKNDTFAEFLLNAADRCVDSIFKGYSPVIGQSGRYDYSDCDLWKSINQERKRIEVLMKNLSKQELITADGEEPEIIDPVTSKPLKPAKYITSKAFVKWEKDE